MGKTEAKRCFALCDLFCIARRKLRTNQAFFNAHADSELLPLPFSDDKSAVGFQFIPQPNGGDGFYYAKLRKRA